jgi:hypothetical protein
MHVPVVLVLVLVVVLVRRASKSRHRSTTSFPSARAVNQPAHPGAKVRPISARSLMSADHLR